MFEPRKCSRMAACVLLLAVASCCSPGRAPDATPSVNEAPSEAPMDARFLNRAQSIADLFAQRQRTHGTPYMPEDDFTPTVPGYVGESDTKLTLQTDFLRFAPGMCSTPPLLDLPVSGADAGPHARKVYFLYAADARAYGPYDGRGFGMSPDTSQEHYLPPAWVRDEKGRLTKPDARQPDFVGQTLVKWSFHPNRTKAGTVAGAPYGAFIMFRVDPSTPGTDDGWVYATTDSKYKVTSVGQMSGCMSCHVSDEHACRLILPREALLEVRSRVARTK